MADQAQTDQQVALNWLSENRSNVGDKNWNNVVSVYNEEARKIGGRPFEMMDLPPIDPMKDMGFLGGIRESFTGTARETQATRRMPSYTQMPEFSTITNLMSTLKATAGTATGTPQEMAQIISTQFPDIKVDQDEKGNYIFTSGIDKKQYAIKPGFEMSDLGRAGVTSAYYIPAAAGTAALAIGGMPAAFVIGGGIALNALTESAIQQMQEEFGGEFDFGDVVLSALLPEALTRVGNGIKNVWRGTMNRVRPPKQIAEGNTLPQDELDDLAARAINGDKQAQQELAALSLPDPEIVAAAERLGIGEFLQPDHVSTDRQFIELMQLIKSWKGGDARVSEINNLVKLGDNTLDQLQQLGAEDVSSLSPRLLSEMNSTVTTLKAEEDKLWDGLRELIPEFDYVPTALIDKLTQKLAAGKYQVNTALNSLERDFLAAFSPTDIVNNKGKVIIKSELEGEVPNFVLMEGFRRRVGNGLNKEGDYASQARGELKQLYKDLLEEEHNLLLEFDEVAQRQRQGDMLTELTGQTSLLPEPIPESAVELFNLARAQSQLRIGVEDDIASIFDAKVANFLGGRLSGAMGQLRKGNANAFVEFVEAIPEEERANVIVSGLGAMFGNQTKMGTLNFNTYTKWFRDLKNQKESYAVLQKYLPENTIRFFEDLNTVSEGVNRAIQENVGRTGASLQLRDILTTETLTQQLFNVAKETGKRAPIEFATSTMGLPGAGIATAFAMSLGKQSSSEAQKKAIEAAQSLITSPAFMNMVKNQYDDASRRTFSLSAPWRRYLRAVNYKGNEVGAADAFIRGTYNTVTTALEMGETGQPVEQEMVAPPQARVQPPAPPTRGIPGMGGATPEAASAPSPTAQGPQVASQSSREMLKALFPMDTLLG